MPLLINSVRGNVVQVAVNYQKDTLHSTDGYKDTTV